MERQDCDFCGWTDGEHASGCPYNLEEKDMDYVYTQVSKTGKSGSCADVTATETVAEFKQIHKGGMMSAGWTRKSDNKRFETAPDHTGVNGQLLGSDGLVGYNEIRARGDVGSAESQYPVAQCPDCGKVLLPRDIDNHAC